MIPLRGFAAHRGAGALMLLSATILALLWANSPWGEVYRDLLSTMVVVDVGGLGLSKPLLLWINDGLMGIFFFVIGLEIKREVLAGELATVRRALFPIAAAVGGMVVPALIYVLINSGGPGLAGWGIPMATDIAFALGVLALLGDRAPLSLKVFLTGLAIVDDIGAILVIAIFYTESISLLSLGVGGAVLAVSLGANLLGVRNPITYFLLGTVVWLAFVKSGIHATLAAVLMALTIPARTVLHGAPLVERITDMVDSLRATPVPAANGLLTPEQQEVLQSLELVADEAQAPLQRLEHVLMPLVTFLVLPVFAFANAGVSLAGTGGWSALAHPVGLGILLGLVLGKQLGVLLFSWLAVRSGLADLPVGVSWRMVHGVAALAGIGFTMSLFIGALAFPNQPQLQDVAKVGVLSASVIASVVGWALLRSAPPARSSGGGDQPPAGGKRSGRRSGAGSGRWVGPRRTYATSAGAESP